MDRTHVIEGVEITRDEVHTALRARGKLHCGHGLRIGEVEFEPGSLVFQTFAPNGGRQPDGTIKGRYVFREARHGDDAERSAFELSDLPGIPNECIGSVDCEE